MLLRKATSTLLVIMILRIYALYGRSIPIVVFLMILWAAQISVSAVGLHTGYSEFIVSHILNLDR